MSSCSIPDRLKNFNVSNWQPEANKSARYSHGELGYFSIDEEAYFLPSKSKLGTLDLPRDCKNTDIDLNAGFEQWKDLPNVQQHLDSMLQWILLNKESLTMTGDLQPSDVDRLNVDFVTSRGNLARILNALTRQDRKGWTMVATRYRGTVYLSHIEEKESLNSFIQKLCYWGKRFEVEVTKSCGTSSERDKAPAQATSLPGASSASPSKNEVERHGPLKAYPGFYSVVRFQLENHRIALRAEVDAQMQNADEQLTPPLNYVELKVTTEASVLSVSKLVPWWCQSIVSGTPLIVCGIRDKDGHVKSIGQVRTDEIPDRVGRGSLDKERYLLFLNDMLIWMKKVVREENVVAVFRYAPGTNVTASVSPRDPENAFLREWYVNEMEDYFATVGKQRKQRGRKGEKRKIEEMH